VRHLLVHHIQDHHVLIHNILARILGNLNLEYIQTWALGLLLLWSRSLTFLQILTILASKIQKQNEGGWRKKEPKATLVVHLLRRHQ
jgi:hypothetical protein